LPLFLAACGGVGPALSVAVIAGDAISYSVSGKNMTDHAYSAMTKKDCAMWRMVKNEPVCKDPALPEGVAVAQGDPVRLDPFVYDDPPRLGETVGPAGGEPSANAARPAAQLAAQPGPARRYLVLGTYADRWESQRAAIRGRDFLPVITRLEDGDKLAYRVVAGPFSSGDSESMRRRLASAGFKDAWPISLCSETFRTPPCRGSSDGIDVANLPRSERRFLLP
jgi:hypothetical protein